MESDKDAEAEVSKAYRAYSTESVPVKLDRAILRKADGVSKVTPWSRLYTWRRPLAFAATLVLGVTLVYDMQTVLRESSSPYYQEPVLRERSDSVSRDMRGAVPAEAGLQTDMPPTTATPGNVPADALTDATSSKFSAQPAADAANTTARKMLQRDDRENLSPARKVEKRLAPTAAPGTASRSMKATAAEATTLQPAEEAPACNDERFDSADLWWNCVRQLRASGNLSAAEAEWQQLLTDYPDFRAPE